MKKSFSAIGIVIVAVLFLVGCEKDITVDLPQADAKIVVQGSIEPGQPPLVILSYTSGYFDPADLNALANSYIRDAQVKMVHGTDTIPLDMYCIADMTIDQLMQASQVSGLLPEAVLGLNICVYTSLSPLSFGLSGEAYTLIVDKD